MKQNIRILFVDDDPNMHKLVGLYLKNAKIQLDLASNGRMALNMVENNTYDLILSDMQMPQLDGFSLIAEVRKRGFNMPIVILSAHQKDDVLEQALKAGAFDILAKPFDRNQLMTVMKKALLDHHQNRLS